VTFNLAVFEEMVYADLERAFDSGIVCCDECRDDFLEYWPWADKADDYEFQKRGIDLQWFYNGGRIRNIWSEEEYWSLMAQLRCPRCEAPLTERIWAFELPFDARDLEDRINEVSELAKLTPFLLLENEFCRDVYSAIKAAAKNVTAANIKQAMYRARAQTSMPKRMVSEFDFPPPRFVGEGRYNHAGSPVLYLASDLETCIKEMRNASSLTLKFELTCPLIVFDHYE